MRCSKRITDGRIISISTSSDNNPISTQKYEIEGQFDDFYEAKLRIIEILNASQYKEERLQDGEINDE